MMKANIGKMMGPSALPRMQGKGKAKAKRLHLQVTPASTSKLQSSMGPYKGRPMAKMMKRPMG